MSYHAPILVISDDDSSPLLAALSEARLEPSAIAGWHDAVDAVTRLRPSAVVATAGHDATLHTLARLVATIKPYVPLIALGPRSDLPENAIGFDGIGFDGDDLARLTARLRAALRVRTLHATTLRRLIEDGGVTPTQAHDPAQDATVLLIGRGAAYPALSVALGERVGVVGALSIEAAAKHLNARELDGIILAEGFSPRVVDAFLTVLSEDARFRNLPIVVTAPPPERPIDLPNLDFAQGEPTRIITRALPLIRQHAFEAQLGRVLRSLDAGGLLEPRTGLLTPAAFERDFAAAVYHAQSRGDGLSVAKFVLHRADPRSRFDTARIVSRLMRKMDFGTLQDDGSILVVFAETDLRGAQTIARRLMAVMKQTSHSARRETRIDPDVSLATLQPDDSARAILSRLTKLDTRRAAS
ncbi:GGDEF domain-containing protein [Rhodopseudomonas sp. HC1]|uniref:GGDEF domain-containing protein n=1 Tax=Rhodopseudomonas infernalis TaxID=2897386 RepID=UPI001EE984B9|nr:GGDEF domain-containing protein [Rhodopseudomonas infernalis]MCG6204301.1 GGDEF domain-containing protein [Rhodopseudomonas infernalis]